MFKKTFAVYEHGLLNNQIKNSIFFDNLIIE